jgi:flagella basal body P-ring formation protein FlgA
MMKQALAWTLLLVLIAVKLLASTTDEAIVEKMMTMYQLDSANYEIELLSQPIRTADLTADQIEIRPLSQKDPLGLFTVIAKVMSADNVLEQGQVRMKIKKYAEVAVAIDRISRYDSFTEDNVAVRRMEVTNLYEKAVESLDDLIDTRAARNVSKGNVLTTGAVEVVPVIERGREIKIVFDNGVCNITAVGIAMENGMAGEYVKVKNQASGKIIVARVVDQTAVAIDP